MPETIIHNNSSIPEEGLHIMDMIGSPPNWIIRSGIGIISLFTFVVLMLSWIIKYPDKLSSTATLTTENPVIEMMPKTTGILDSILVYNNQLVESHQLLSTIKDAAKYEDVNKLKLFLLACNDFQTTGWPIAPENLQLGSLSDVFASLQQSIKSYEYFLAQDDVEKQLEAIDKEINNTSLLNESTLKQISLLENESQIIKTDLVRNRQLRKEGVISEVSLEEKEKTMIQYQRQLEGLSANILQNKIRIEQLKQQQNQLAQSWKDEKMNLVTHLQQQIESLKGAVSNWEETYTIHSPIKGAVVYAPKLSNKQTVNPGNIIMTIVPIEDRGATIIRCDANISGIGKVEKGTPVKLSLDAYPEREYGVLQTIVEAISMVPSSNQSGQNVYEIIAPLPDTLITSYNKEIPLRQNMSGTATFITKDRSILERLFESLTDLTKN
ncbi:MAG: HlyD family efflux transporter periplasmic adaptor subunit [Chitinophagales bacterium]|nr:HlyD family efflux transporter periplasmic adaptor subunit [Chitinophagales bacterium]